MRRLSKIILASFVFVICSTGLVTAAAPLVGWDQYNGTKATIRARTVVFTLPSEGQIRSIMGKRVVASCTRQVAHARYQEKETVWKAGSETLRVTFKKKIGSSPVLCEVTTVKNPYAESWIAVVAPGLGKPAVPGAAN